MNYDIDANIISWEIGKGKITHVKEFGNFLVHLSPAGKPILIEILDATKFKTRLSNLKTLEQINEALAS